MDHAVLPGPTPWPGRPGAPSTLRLCITLAVLLHVLVVLVFGNTEGGSAPPGQGVWGALNIRLAGSDPAGRADATVPSDAYSGPQGEARERRWGGAVRAPQDAPDAHRSAGAARAGVWQPQPTPEAAPDAPPAAVPDLPPARAADLPPAASPAAAQALPQSEVPAAVPAHPVPEAAPDRVPLVAQPLEALPAIAPARLPDPPVADLQSMPLPVLNLPALAPPPVPAPEPVPVPVPVPGAFTIAFCASALEIACLTPALKAVNALVEPESVVKTQ